jgi:hypothetical protein
MTAHLVIASSSESGETSRKCPRTARGRLCTAPLLSDGSGHCVFHSPAHRERGPEVRRRAAARTNAILHPPILDPVDVPVLDVSTDDKFREYQTRIIDLVARGQLDVPRARFLQHMASQARRDLDRRNSDQQSQDLLGLAQAFLFSNHDTEPSDCEHSAQGPGSESGDEDGSQVTEAPGPTVDTDQDSPPEVASRPAPPAGQVLAGYPGKAAPARPSDHFAAVHWDAVFADAYGPDGSLLPAHLRQPPARRGRPWR